MSEVIQFIPDRQISIDEAIEEYLAYSQSIGTLSATSVFNRRCELVRFMRYCHNKQIQGVTEIKKHLVITYLGSLTIQNNSKKTIMMIMTAFFDYLVTEGLILDNLVANIKKPRTFLPEGDFLSLEEINRLFYAETNNTSEKLVDRNILLLSLFTVLCMRVAEAIQLVKTDVHLNERQVWVKRKGGKIARLPLNEDLVDRFNNWFDERVNFKNADKVPWVFVSTHGRQMTIRQARNVVTNALKKASISKRKCGPHLLRHSGATLYLKQGEDIKTIQYLLGHANLSTTSRYVHSDSDTLKNSINNCPSFGT
ncbi:MAG: Tyrosine recombinase XerD [Candidatus Magnetoglobus multicellularis str. Araruama]|uniref:Tyrosine recombinase XerD n=1 Tax=Candidatus Magnetoglobus multicellularis str. Araruama TaxID=890399 RepID=A0A1V1PC80_9BACT|nr:MAG: Tyrosine recombinase XerD [Candidatus Magnetoglobus multicellularis str. Araruama]